jgi:hypothetical protein
MCHAAGCETEDDEEVFFGFMMRYAPTAPAPTINQGFMGVLNERP